MTAMSTTRRRFIAGTGAWLGASAAGIAADPQRSRIISIFHTTDLHGNILPTRTYDGVPDVGGLARCATRIRQWRRESPHSILLDIGDVYQGTAESRINNGNLMIQQFNRLGYDAWTLGNHDFDWGPEALENNLALSKSPILTGNIRVAGKSPGSLNGAWKDVLPWMMKEVGGFRIALIGLVTPGLPYWLSQESLGGVHVEAPTESLKRSIAQARSAKADAIVVMSHMGWRYFDDFANPVREMLKQAPGADVMLAGHTHQNQPSWMSSDVLCTQAGYYGIHCGRVDLTFDLETRKLTGRQAVTEYMDDRFALDPAVMELAAPDLKTASEQQARKVGSVTRTIKGTGSGQSPRPPFLRVFCRSAQTQQDARRRGFSRHVRHRRLPAGDITVGDCWTLLPYENLLVTAELCAEELIGDRPRRARASGSPTASSGPSTSKLDHDGTPCVSISTANPSPRARVSPSASTATTPSPADSPSCASAKSCPDPRPNSPKPPSKPAPRSSTASSPAARSDDPPC